MNVSWLEKLIINSIIFSVLSMLLAFSSYFFNDAWIEWKLSEKLRKEGIPTQAVVQSCTRRRGNCNTTYRYEAPSSDQQIQTVTVHEYGCNCRKGQQITIFYLPDNPSQARLYTNKYLNSLNFAILQFLIVIGLGITFLFSNFIDKKVFILKNKKGAKKIKSHKKRAAMELVLFILIFTLPGFIFGLFLDLVIFKEVVKIDVFFNIGEELIKIGIYASLLTVPHALLIKDKKFILYYAITLFTLINLIVGGRFWFIIQPLITLGARLVWTLHDLRIYVWSLFWGLITIWVVISWMASSIEDDVKPAQSDDLAK